MSYDLSSISKQRSNLPPRILVYGAAGIGKTTFGSQAPSPFFLQCGEDGEGDLELSGAFANAISDVVGWLNALMSDDHEYETIVLDTLDWLEHIVWTQVAADQGLKSIEEIDYGKGYVFACDAFDFILTKLNALRRERGMAVILLSHSAVTTFKDPVVGPYDQYHPALHKLVRARVVDWCDVIGFASIATSLKETDKRTKATRAIGSRRVLHTIGAPAFIAKSRYNIPSPITFSWSDFSDAFQNRHNQEDR